MSTIAFNGFKAKIEISKNEPRLTVGMFFEGTGNNGKNKPK